MKENGITDASRDSVKVSELPMPLVMTSDQRRYIFEICARLVVALFNLAFAASLLTDIIQFHRLSSILSLALSLVVVVCILFRRISTQANLAPYDWFIAFYGTLLPMLMRPFSQGSDLVVLTVIQTVGTIVAIAGILSLNRSFGIVAANRGVQTFGLYRYVRHPIYAGYVLSIGAAWAQNLNLWNSVIFTLWLVFEVLRIFAEERHLLQDPTYRQYTQNVRWRLCPHVF